MKERGLVDEAAAKLFGVDRATVSKWRRSKLLPSYEVMLRIRDRTEGMVTLESWAVLRALNETTQGEAA